MDEMTNLTNIENAIQESFSQTLSSSNEQINQEQTAFSQEVNSSGKHLFEDEESMDYLMNQIGLAVQRNGGQ